MLLRTMSILTLVFSFIFVSCSPKHSEIVLSKFGDREIKMEEFEKVYAKNAGSLEQAKKDSLSKLKSFLDLYTNFQMKLRDSEVRGYQNDPNLINELNDYKKKVGTTYILEKQLVEPALKKYYERRKLEFRVSYIMIKPDSNAGAAKKLADDILARIKKGENYETLCAKYSQDKFTKDKGGDIYYVTAGLLPPVFEDAIYSTPVGSVYPYVLDTRWGYYILKVTDKKDRIPQIRASHIMVAFTNAAGVADTLAAKQKIDSIAAMIKAGKSFKELAAKYSADPGSKENGGDLGFFERRRMIPEFDEAAFKLNVGEVSPVIKTQFGFHIIKVTDKKPYPDFESDKENLKTIYKQAKYNADYENFLDSLKKKFNYTVNKDAVIKVTTKNDSAKVVPGLLESDFVKSIKGLTLFTLNNKNYSADSVLSIVVNSSEYNNRLVDTLLIKQVLKKTSDDLALSEEAMNYDKENPEFAALMEDYKNGIYIFKLQDEEVWGKIAVDSTKLMSYYEKTKSNYVMPDRVSFEEITVAGDSLKTVVNDLLKSGENFDSVAVKYSEKKGENGKAFAWALTDVSTNDLSKAAAKIDKIGDFVSIPYDGGYSVVKLTAKEKTRLKTFEEAKAEVSGAYQEVEGKRLENEYLKQLNTIYKPVFNYENLEKAYKAE